MKSNSGANGSQIDACQGPKMRELADGGYIERAEPVLLIVAITANSNAVSAILPHRVASPRTVNLAKARAEAGVLIFLLCSRIPARTNQMLIIVTPEDARKDRTTLPWTGAKLGRARPHSGGRLRSVRSSGMILVAATVKSI